MIIENATSNVSVYISILSKGFPTSIHSSSLTFIKMLFLLYSHDITNVSHCIFLELKIYIRCYRDVYDDGRWSYITLVGKIGTFRNILHTPLDLYYVYQC